MAIPVVTKQLTDGNLERATGNGVANRRILFLGTAEDGPMYTPVDLSDITVGQEVFGRVGQGTLLMAVNEALLAQEGSAGTPQISAVRIGSNFATKSHLTLTDGSNDVLKLEALFAGDIYNDISIEVKTNEVRIYNPKTETWSVFKYDEDANNTSADFHNVSQLADAINADVNLMNIMLAESLEYELNYELQVNSSDAVVTNADDSTTELTLSSAMDADLVSGARYLDGATNLTDLESGNREKTISSITKAYAISESGVKEYEASGLTSVKTRQFPLDGKSDARFNTILGASMASGNLASLANDVLGSVGSEAYLRHRGVGVGKVSLADTDTEFVFTVKAPWGYAHEAATAAAATVCQAVFGLTSPTNDAEIAARIEPTPLADDDLALSVTAPIKLEYHIPGTAEGEWQDFGLLATDFTASWAAGVLTITVNDAARVSELYTINDAELRVSFDSAIGSMSEKSTLTLVQSSSAVFSDYFVRGKEIIFGAPLPANIVFRHGTIQYYELGSTMELVDEYEPIISFHGKGIQPGIDGAAIDGTNDAIIGLVYDVVPDMAAAGNDHLSSGTNAIKLSNAALYDELIDAFANLDDQQFDIVVVPGAYIDSTKTGYNEITGLPQEVNAEFHLAMSSFLSSYNGEAIGIMGFKPLVGTGTNGTITRLDVAARAEKLTEQNVSDPMRAANFLAPFSEKAMIAVDAEPVFLLNGKPYATTAESWVAGYLSTLASNKTIYIENIPGSYGLRYSYSERLADGRSQLDALSDARIITATSGVNGVKLTDGPTLAKAGSDYERLTTFWIASEAAAVTRAIAQDYLGRTASIEILQALETRLRADLNALVPNKLQAVSFKIKSSPQQRVLGQLEILLVLVPVFEIRSISVPIVLKADATQIASALQ